MTGTTLDPVAKALLCQKAEHEYPGMPCGIMDQFASTLCTADHLMLLDCRSRQVELIPFTDPQLTVLIINSNVKHELSGGEYAERRGQCEAASQKLGVSSLRDATLDRLGSGPGKLSPLEYQRARHAISEIARTVDAAEAMKAGDWSKVGQLMVASHESLRDDYEVSCRELDLLVELAHGIGRAGRRLRLADDRRRLRRLHGEPRRDGPRRRDRQSRSPPPTSAKPASSRRSSPAARRAGRMWLRRTDSAACRRSQLTLP